MSLLSYLPAEAIEAWEKYGKMTDEERLALEKRIAAEKKDRTLQKGWYSMPRGLIWLVKNKKITKAEYLVINILLHLENCFAPGNTLKQKRGKWFFCTMEDIMSYGLISEKPFRTARKALILKKFIEYKEGYPGSASLYRILDIDGQLPTSNKSTSRRLRVVKVQHQ